MPYLCLGFTNGISLVLLLVLPWFCSCVCLGIAVGKVQLEVLVLQFRFAEKLLQFGFAEKPCWAFLLYKLKLWLSKPPDKVYKKSDRLI
jgi:hypothetical protein